MGIFNRGKTEYSISYRLFSDPGNREVNEDSVGFCQKNREMCFVLCDGLGGHGMGDLASSLAVETIKNQFANTIDNSYFIKSAFPAAHDIIIAEQAQRKAGNKMKTTGVLALVADEKISLCHIGDSRGYIFYKNDTYKRTLDHSVPQMMALSKRIKEEEIRNHPDRCLVLKALGADIEGSLNFDIMKPEKVSKAKAILLASDGFWELINEDIMIRLLNESISVDEWIDKMVCVIRENGKDINMDNFSAIAVWFQ